MVRKFENPSDEVNLNTLVIIFLLGLLILFGTYFTFFDKAEYGPHAVIRVCGFVQGVYKGFCGFVQGVYKGFCGFVQGVYKGFCGFVQNAYKTVLKHVQNNYRFLKGQLDKALSYVSYSSVRNHFLSPVHTSNSDSFEFKSCADCALIAQFEKENNLLKVEYIIPHNKGRLSIFFHKIFERIFDIPVDYGWVSIASEISNANWSDYDTINFFVKGDGWPSRLEFSVYEADGDAWYFFDEKVLKTEDWASVSMPFEDFVPPSWALQGGGKKDLRNVTMFQLTITSFDKAVNNTLYFKLKNNSLVYLE